MTEATKVETAVDFKKVVVDQDYADYKSSRTDLRRAYHLATGLFHLRDWTFLQYSGEPGWPYGQDLGAYQKVLESVCREFGYIRDLANSVKHGELNPNMKPSTQMVGLANTQKSSASFSTAFSSGFAIQTFIVSQTSPTERVVFEQAADAVMNMWNTLFCDNSWH